ncbi:MAG TPA: TonB family protein [Pyrinomonadaceae bacterium]|nr:TonB family protein [Pyrinomonadaceae bacterium]
MRRLLFAVFLCASCVPFAAHAAAVGVEHEGVRPQETSVQSTELAEAREQSARASKLFGERKLDEAEAAAKRSVTLYEKAAGADHLALVTPLTTLAGVNVLKHKDDAAEPLYKRALAIYEKRGQAETGNAATIIDELGFLRFRKGDHEAAAQLFERSLAIREKLYGVDHPNLFKSLFNLANIYTVRRRIEKADPLYERGIAILEKLPPHQNPSAVRELRNYACISISNKRPEAFRRAMDLATRLENPELAAANERREKEFKEKGAELDGEGVLKGHVVNKPQPVYPESAKSARISGTVIVAVVVDETGRVTHAEALCGHPTLAKASVEAARRARFAPTLLSGQPVKVTGTITYDFVLNY